MREWLTRQSERTSFRDVAPSLKRLVMKLHVRPENHRARHIYLREGFTRHGEDLASEYLSVTRARWSA